VVPWDPRGVLRGSFPPPSVFPLLCVSCECVSPKVVSSTFWRTNSKLRGSLLVPACALASINSHFYGPRRQPRAAAVGARPRRPMGRDDLQRRGQRRPPRAAAVGARPDPARPVGRVHLHVRGMCRPPLAAAVGARPAPTSSVGSHAAAAWGGPQAPRATCARAAAPAWGPSGPPQAAAASSCGRGRLGRAQTPPAP